uniref:F-box domain-containing protein n=1 Tax=Cuerna arida TaxID=1464854 RepID=A0A1B6F995_9HEMI
MDENIRNGLLSTNSTSSETNILNLPWEVVQYIFCLLDGKSLIMCKRVSKSWKEHVHYLEKNVLYWYNHCNKEIPAGAQFDLLDHIFPSHWENQNCVNWQIMYKSWCFWNSLKSLSPSVERFVTGLDGISAIKVSGEWLLMSTCHGRGKLVAKNLSKHTMLDVYVGTGAILGFHLAISDRVCVSNVKNSGVLEDFFSTLNHNEIWLELKDSFVQIGKTYCHMVDKVRQKIRHSYGYEARLINEGHHSVLYLNKTSSRVKGPEVMELELCRQYGSIVDFWQNKITVRDSKRPQMDTFTINMRTQEVLEHSPMQIYKSTRDFVRVYSWHGVFFITYSNRRSLIFKTDKGIFDITTSIKMGCISSVLYYSTYLFLGSDRGQLMIYRIKDPERETQWSLPEHGNEHDPAFCCLIQVGHIKIVEIAVVEPSHHSENKPMILCASPEDVYLISFPKL